MCCCDGSNRGGRVRHLSPSSQITAVAPPLSAGDWDITVTTPGGTSALSSGDRSRSESATDVTLAQAA